MPHDIGEDRSRLLTERGDRDFVEHGHILARVPAVYTTYVTYANQVERGICPPQSTRPATTSEAEDWVDAVYSSMLAVVAANSSAPIWKRGGIAIQSDKDPPVIAATQAFGLG